MAFLESGPLLLAWLVAANVVGFLAAVTDKSRARRGRSRIPEAVFHVLALLGGWLGELVAFLAVRHKTRKRRFQAVFLLATAVNVGLLAWWARTSLA